MIYYGTSIIEGSAYGTAKAERNQASLVGSSHLSVREIDAGYSAQLSGSATVTYDNRTTLYISRGSSLEIQRFTGGSGSSVNSKPSPIKPVKYGKSYTVDIRPCDNEDLVPFVQANLLWDNERWNLVVTALEVVDFNGFRIRDYTVRFFGKDGRRIDVDKLDSPIDSFLDGTELPCDGYFEIWKDGEIVLTNSFIVEDNPVACEGRKIYNFSTCCYEFTEEIYDGTCFSQGKTINPDNGKTTGAVLTAGPPAGQVCVGGTLYPSHSVYEPEAISNSTLRLGQYPVLSAPSGALATPTTIQPTAEFVTLDDTMTLYLIARVPETNLSVTFQLMNLFDQVDVSQVVVEETVTGDNFDVLFKTYIWMVVFDIPYGYIDSVGNVHDSFFRSGLNQHGLIKAPASTAIAIPTETAVTKFGMANVFWDWNHYFPTNNIHPYQWMRVTIDRKSQHGESFGIDIEDCPPMNLDIDSLEATVTISTSPLIALPPYYGSLTIASGFYGYARRVMYLANNRSVRHATWKGLLPNGGSI